MSAYFIYKVREFIEANRGKTVDSHTMIEDALERFAKEVARDQRHACAEACAASDEFTGAAAHYHGIAFNARPERDE